MTCKDCIFRVMCYKHEHYGYGYEYNEEPCEMFKNKADFVEVVRCERCDYKDDCARQMVHTTRDYVLEQNISTYNKVDFCSYGERK